MGEYLFPCAVTRALTLRQLRTLQLSKLGSEVLSSGFATPLQMLSVGLVMVTNGARLPEEMRQSLTEALPLFEDLAHTDPVLEKRLIYLKLLSNPASVERLPIGPSTIRLDPRWLTDAPTFLGQCGEIPPGALRLFNRALGFATDGGAGQREARAFLSFVQNERETFFLRLDPTRAEPEALWRFLEGPNPEFRDPARFALLEAFPDKYSYAVLGYLLKAVVPFRLDDLEPEKFQQVVAANPEHALETYVELADRVGGLETLLRKARVLVPGSRKLRSVCDSLKRWRIAARKTVLTTQLNQERIFAMRADLTKKASLNTMVRLSSVAEGLEGFERAGHEPETAAEEFEGRQGYDRNFLDGFDIKLPRATGAAKNDMLAIAGGSEVELKYMHFSVIMSVERRLPMLTAVNIDASQSRRLPRINTWSFDGRIEKSQQFGDALYDSNALDRGHMVRREDPVWGSPEDANTANGDTFHFTNSCPQMAGVNQQTWLSLENYILQHARADKMRVTVFTGPFFSEDDLEYRDAKVPAAFWKVVAIVTEDGRPSATAYKVSQARELADLEFVFAGFKTYQISIQQVMNATHLDFSHLLEFDGFSQHESVTGVEMVEQLDDLALIRV